MYLAANRDCSASYTMGGLPFPFGAKPAKQRMVDRSIPSTKNNANATNAISMESNDE